MVYFSKKKKKTISWSICPKQYHCAGMDELLMDCRVGRTTKEKLKKVIEWVLRAGSTLHYQQTHSYQVFSMAFLVDFYIYFCFVYLLVIETIGFNDTL